MELKKAQTLSVTEPFNPVETWLRPTIPLGSPIVRRNYIEEIRAAYYHGDTIDANEVLANACISAITAQPVRYDSSAFYAKAWFAVFTVRGYEMAGRNLNFPVGDGVHFINNPQAAASEVLSTFKSGHLMPSQTPSDQPTLTSKGLFVRGHPTNHRLRADD
ncbi:Hypothetical protein FKW44_022900 [Caligus rogercresseyi]|uniref:Uncharacterized protein n=1 Tax=Caligus rogercresseyi TaxID=217165 RepID=A0A7T8GP26_CALRO|nr:Hypothetical protein FKW44_022900 [Caligus rogercresseyi]